MALLIVPFFSVNANIFNDGTVPTVGPKSDTSWRCFDGGAYHNNITKGQCGSIVRDIFENTICNQNEHGCQNVEVITTVLTEVKTSYTVIGERCTGINTGTGECYRWENDRQRQGIEDNPNPWASCPPDTNPTYTYPIDDDDDGRPDRCADPAQIDLFDSCNLESGNEYLNLRVNSSHESVCATQSDGSICMYNKTDVGLGNSVYRMDLEGSCYVDEPPFNADDFTEISGTVSDQNGYQCIKDGGLLSCEADPDFMCPDGNCHEGCGYTNDEFRCYDIDTDEDGLPDYDDPDIDGDGIANEDDLDSDGDGVDDPISGDNGSVNNGSGNNGSGNNGSGEINLDLSGVESRLDDIKDIMETPLTRSDEKGSYDMDGVNTRLEEKNQELQDTIDDIKQEAETLVNTIATGTGSFSHCYNVAQYRGSTKQSCTNDYQDEVSAIPSAVYLVFAIASAFIVLGGRTS